MLAAEDVADIDPVMLPADAAIAADDAALVVRRILDRLQPIEYPARGTAVERERRPLPERFVRPVVVVLGLEGMEAALLRRRVALWRPGRLGLERAVHALMASVLLGMGGLDDLGVDARADPPDRQPRQAAERRRGEGDAVVGAEDLRQAVLVEEPGEDRFRRPVGGGAQSLVAEQVATEAVHDRERVAVDPVARPELT